LPPREEERGLTVPPPDVDIQLDRSSAIPLYTQLEQIFRTEIASGNWAVRERIPSENQLTARYGVARMTVRNVLTKLVEDGALFRVAGKGTFVTARKISAASPAYMGIREQLERLGFTITTELVRSEIEEPSQEVREALDLADSELVFAIERVRSADGEPISRHESWVPASLAPGLDQYDVVNEQLCVVLDREFRLPMRHIDEQLETVGATQHVAHILGIRVGEPVLRLRDRISDSLERPFEYSRITFRGDRMQLRFQYEL
jgi:GntR family transcriptional regulator